MPNHCYQEVSILGPRPVVRHLYESVFDPCIRGGSRRFCDVVIPFPLSEVGDGYNWRVANWGTKWDVCEVSLVYDFKLEAEDLKIQEASFTFKCWTAWAPPVPVWDRLVNEFGCIVTADYHDEGGLFEGEYNCSDSRWEPGEKTRMTYNSKETYWAGKGRYEAEESILHDLIDEKLVYDNPDCPYTARMPRSHSGGGNYHLEKLRKAKYAYYRWFNDGDSSNIFSHRATLKKVGGHGANDQTVELIMDLKIQEAWAEQKGAVLLVPGAP